MAKPKIVRCPNCGAVMVKRSRAGKGFRVGIVYECPNSDCSIIDVRVRYGRGKSGNPKSVRVVRDSTFK